MDFLGTSQKEAQFPFPWFNCLWNLKSRLLNELLGPIKKFLKRLFRRSNFSWWKILLFEHQKNVESLWIDLKEPIIGFTNLFDLLFKSPFQPCLFMYKAFIPCLNTQFFPFWELSTKFLFTWLSQQEGNSTLLKKEGCCLDSICN